MSQTEKETHNEALTLINELKLNADDIRSLQAFYSCSRDEVLDLTHELIELLTQSPNIENWHPNTRKAMGRLLITLTQRLKSAA